MWHAWYSGGSGAALKALKQGYGKLESGIWSSYFPVATWHAGGTVVGNCGDGSRHSEVNFLNSEARGASVDRREALPTGSGK